MVRQNLAVPTELLHLANETGEAVGADEARRQCSDFLGARPFREVQNRGQKNATADSYDARNKSERQPEQKTKSSDPLPNAVVLPLGAFLHRKKKEQARNRKRRGEEDLKGRFLDDIESPKIRGGDRQENEWQAAPRGKKSCSGELRETLRGDDQVAGQ